MHKIITKLQLSPNVFQLEVTAPRIAQIRQAGQFVIVRKGEFAERIPLTIANSDAEKGTITLVIQAVGKSTIELTEMNVDDYISDIAGPLGKSTELIESGHAVCVGGGVGTAVVNPIAQALSGKKVQVTSIIGGRSQEWVIFEQELSQYGKVIPCTDDGSYGQHGFVTNALKDLLDKGGVDIVYAVGPVPMMENVVKMTRDYNVHTIVSLNPIMIDGTGMCGGCRVTVDGKQKFACVDGPEFDGHNVDFVELKDRLTSYGNYERESLEIYEHDCKLGIASKIHQPHYTPYDHPLQANPISDDVLTYGLDIKKKERMKIQRQLMPEQQPEVRMHNFGEVNLGFTEKLMLEEARRCIQCKEKQCIDGCPVMVNIPEFIEHLVNGNIEAAAQTMVNDNVLPAVTGRVCPQETQCEAVCIRGIKGAPVAIGYLERYVGDWLRYHDLPYTRPIQTGKKAAIIGSGPAGLTAAGELVKRGHDVTIYEALHKPGGVLVYGIPEFRLPKSIVQEEVDRLIKQGVKVECDVIVGKTYTIEELREQFDTIFIANGAGLPVFMNVNGENFKGVYSANEYLTRANLMGAFDFPNTDTPIIKGRKVAVVGGGNVAMDAVRTGKRLGAEESTIVYRRTRVEMPARVEEVAHAEHEGIKFEMLVAPLEVLGDDKGWVKGLRCQRMKLGDPDASGRRRPLPIEGSEFIIDCDVIVVAIGSRANPLLTSTCPALKLNKWGNIEIDDYGQTSIPGVFAGGDIVRGAATVILAMGDGKKAAASMHRFMMGESLTPDAKVA